MFLRFGVPAARVLDSGTLQNVLHSEAAGSFSFLAFSVQAGLKLFTLGEF